MYVVKRILETGLIPTQLAFDGLEEFSFKTRTMMTCNDLGTAEFNMKELANLEVDCLKRSLEKYVELNTSISWKYVGRSFFETNYGIDGQIADMMGLTDKGIFVSCCEDDDDRYVTIAYYIMKI